jgi:hypothetical protein
MSDPLLEHPWISQFCGRPTRSQNDDVKWEPLLTPRVLCHDIGEISALKLAVLPSGRKFGRIKKIGLKKNKSGRKYLRLSCFFYIQMTLEFCYIDEQISLKKVWVCEVEIFIFPCSQYLSGRLPGNFCQELATRQVVREKKMDASIIVWNFCPLTVWNKVSSRQSKRCEHWL